uniref:alpha-1,2-Mannosidase n=1 Tax=Meloidogyne incognita TaxID=6306 RepID=A0A914MRJ6_MELIC
MCYSTWILPKILIIICVFFAYHGNSTNFDFSEKKKELYREKVKSMFYHAYNGYLNYAYPKDELRPLSCTGQDTWGSYSLTLIDSLDTLLILGNQTEFVRASQIVLNNMDLDRNINISVFETNIRVIGGLLSAHMLSSHSPDVILNDGWPCSGPLLELAERFAQRLLPAFRSNTGMPYGTVNLKYGLNNFENTVTCVAGIGTFILEFGALSRLTGIPHYERIALKALDSLWKSRSELGLVGNHIDVQTGVFTATDSGIGAGVDSYFEYLVKGSLLFQRQNLIKQFYEFEEAINLHIRKGDWFMWVDKDKATVSLPIFQSLEAFWPGLLTLIGKVEDAARILSSYLQVLRHLGLPPEFYNIPNREPVQKRLGYPLRPEILESLMYLYKATEDPAYLHVAAGIVDTIEQFTKTKCGYASVRDVQKWTLEDRMESFFLSETIKYLYLIFDEKNFIHNDGTSAKLLETTDGHCIIEAGGWIFNTEAHPLDSGIIHCCSKKRHNDFVLLRDFEQNIDFLSFTDNLNEMMHDFKQSYNESLARQEKQQNFEEQTFIQQKFQQKLVMKEFHPDDKSENLENAQLNRISILDCCNIFDDPSLGQNSRLFWHLIYSNYFGVKQLCDPIFKCCSSLNKNDTEEFNEEKNYSNTFPDLSSLSSYYQNLDSVLDGFSLNKFKYLKPNPTDEQQNFSLLTDNNPLPFSLNFLGLGQIV